MSERYDNVLFLYDISSSHSYFLWYKFPYHRFNLFSGQFDKYKKSAQQMRSSEINKFDFIPMTIIYCIPHLVFPAMCPCLFLEFI